MGGQGRLDALLRHVSFLQRSRQIGLHADVMITDGQESYRLAQATAGKGVKPLT
jgi:hypothetical protein